jgi:hypothetical protein
MTTPFGRAARWCAPLLLSLVGLLIWNPPGNFWKSVEPPKAQVEAYDPEALRQVQTLTSAVYDQRKLDRLVREPQNTISNLAYVYAGLVILFAARKPVARNLALAAIFLGVGSGMYHASLLPEWRMIDILGVYAVLYFLVLMGVTGNLRRGDKGWVAWGLCAVVWWLAIYTGIHRNDIRGFGVKLFDSSYVFVAGVAAGCVLAGLAYLRATHRRDCGRALVVLGMAAAVSFAAGLGDRYGGFWAVPTAPIQGHAIWHTFGAIALLAAYEALAAAGFDTSLWAKSPTTAELARK